MQARTSWSQAVLPKLTVIKCLEELRDKAKAFKETGIVVALDFDCKVVYSDLAAPAEIAQALSKAVAPLENVPEEAKDWHPGSSGQVLDLVHPSLYPLIYGRSRVLSHGEVPLEDCVSCIGQGEVVPEAKMDTEIEAHLCEEELQKSQTGLTVIQWEPSMTPQTYMGTQNEGHRITDIQQDKDAWSTRYQWLPSDVSFYKSGHQVRFTSYINNLHPTRHKSLYGVIEALLSRSIPLWNEVLESTEVVVQPRLDVNSYHFEYPQGEDRPREEGENSDTDEFLDRNHEWRELTRILHHPEPTKAYTTRPRAEPGRRVDLAKDFSDNGLQVIVKLANIHLTPTSPTYPGGSWHIEGQLNEHIVATSLYYYDQSNITQSSLAFRQRMDADSLDLSYEQDDPKGIEEVLGAKDGECAYSNLGAVATKEGRLLAFPNVLQHRVPPFQLEDPSKSGHRKILALFLVDPYIRILSTAKVPPQQRAWYDEAIHATEVPSRSTGQPIGSGSDEPSNMRAVTIDLEEAKEMRAELMHERSRITTVVDAWDERNTFNFCEH